ncbi:MAG: hypothetical protein ABR519_04675 [Bacteroidales bacterium]
MRIILIAVLIYLVVRLIRQFFNGGGGDGPTINNRSEGKKVSDDTGEYVDYEEVKK